MMEFLTAFASNPQGGATLVIATSLFSITQFFITKYQNKVQTKSLGTNHLEHLRDDIGQIIGQHETREMEISRQTADSLGRIERLLIEQNSRKCK